MGRVGVLTCSVARLGGTHRARFGVDPQDLRAAARTAPMIILLKNGDSAWRERYARSDRLATVCNAPQVTIGDRSGVARVAPRSHIPIVKNSMKEDRDRWQTTQISPSESRRPLGARRRLRVRPEARASRSGRRRMGDSTFGTRRILPVRFWSSAAVLGKA
jgi:hypothetical protein